MELAGEGKTKSVMFSDYLSTAYALINNSSKRVNSVDGSFFNKTKPTNLAFIATVLVFAICGALYITLHFLSHTSWADNSEALSLMLSITLVSFYILTSITIRFQYLCVKKLRGRVTDYAKRN